MSEKKEKRNLTVRDVIRELTELHPATPVLFRDSENGWCHVKQVAPTIGHQTPNGEIFQYPPVDQSEKCHCVVFID